MLKKFLRLVLCAAVVLVTVFPVHAMPEGVPLLAVELQDLSMNSVAAGETDALGFFSIGGLAAADYLLVVPDPASDIE